MYCSTVQFLKVEKSEVIDRTSSLYIGDGMSGNGNKCASAARELLQAPSNCTAFHVQVVALSKQASKEGLSMEIFYNSTINQPNKSRLCSCNFFAACLTAEGGHYTFMQVPNFPTVFLEATKRLIDKCWCIYGGDV